MENAARVNGSFSLNEIVEQRQSAPSLMMWKLYVPDIAERVKPGQFVVLRTLAQRRRIQELPGELIVAIRWEDRLDHDCTRKAERVPETLLHR